MSHASVQRWRGVLGSRPAWAVLVLALVLTGWAAWDQYTDQLTLHDAVAGTRPMPLEQAKVEAQRDSALVAITGLAVSGLLFALVRRLTAARAEMEAIALTDELTGLANRKQLMRQLEATVQRTTDDPDYHFALLFLDFDRFKVINDSLGHEAGDELLRQIADRLRRHTRSDISHGADLPARLGGDEFVVLLQARRAVSDAIAVADRLLHELGEPYNLDGHEVVSTASIGIVTSDGRYTRADHIIRDADLAMYQAKDTGKARYVVFDAALHNAAMHRLELERALRQAVARRQLALVYQPILSLEDGRVVGAEALLRWHHPELGVVSPEQFIPIAEETGLIVPIGQWMVNQACAQLAHFQRTLPEAERLSLNVNIARRELTSPGMVERLAQALATHQIDPTLLHLEITESVIMSHLTELEPVLQRLRDLGLPLCMDDFGTGHSSLSCLHQFPIDVLKIDRAFVSNLGTALDYSAIIQAVITLAHTLNMTVVAEGIETAGQLAQLQTLDCDHAQGYFFAKPMTDEAFEQFYRRSLSMGDRAGAMAAPFELNA